MEETTLNKFKDIVGSQYVKTESHALQAYGRDWTKDHSPDPKLVVLPHSTEQVVEIVNLCRTLQFNIVPSGGRTGLAGAAVSANGEIVVSFDRMNSMNPVDRIGLTVEVEAGVTTQAVQEAANEADLFFALDLAAKGSSQIGGNIATNAGGTKLIRYGGMREQVLGIEVVLPNGQVLDINTSLRKDNTGYDLKQLFIGSEGTLGLITKATLKLMPKPKELQLVLMAVESFQKIPSILEHCNVSGIPVSAFEFFSDKALNLVTTYHSSLKNPLSGSFPFYVLLEIEGGKQGLEQYVEPLSEKVFEQSLVADAIIASSSSQFSELWSLRENISESISQHGRVRKNDISVPIHRLASFIEDIDDILSASAGDIDIILFGHIGDGNLHINYSAPETLDKNIFDQQARAVEAKIFDMLPNYSGSVSAEHGIGLLKKADFARTAPAGSIELMKNIKSVFDPTHMMNPGKVFD